MATHKNFSKKKQLKQTGAYDNVDSPLANDPINDTEKENLSDDAWIEYIDYYRQYIDKFCIEVLGLKLHFFQRMILRAMSRHQYVCLICCRGKFQCPFI
ncbi:hypothetical protein ACSXEK_16400 (plasmid) [Clostridium perfringens]